MKKSRFVIPLHEDVHINLDIWLKHLFSQYPETEYPILRQAATLAQVTGLDKGTPTGQSCLQQGIYMADILMELAVDPESLAAAMLYHCARHTDLTLDDISEQTSPAVAKLITGVKRMDALQNLSEQSKGTTLNAPHNLDNIRKMLLAMVDDVRIVLIKLAERLAVLRHIAWLPDAEKRNEAKITQDIYAPLANRLGIGQLKWELEDLSFRYLHPDIYAELRTALNAKRSEREQYVQQVINILKNEATALGITDCEVAGRAKHIYSIYSKMTRKKVPFSEIYDVLAFRLLVPTVEDCYKLLGQIHSLWTPIPKEFDDYVSNPKPNGYRSIHTAVLGPDNKTIEVQIRTVQMHQEAEMGVAAHWIYKEGKPVATGYEAKIAWLRQVMEWQLEVTKTDKPTQEAYANLLNEHIYVFTPQGDVIEMVKDATPLDFAYHIHTGLGHRCRGARVNGQIAPLTHALKTGEVVEVIASKEEHPSRDWLMPSQGYLKTSRAKSKVLHWFREQNAEENQKQGKLLLDKEIRRLSLKEVPYEQLLKRMHFVSLEDLYASLGRGDTALSAVMASLQGLLEQVSAVETPSSILPVVVPSQKTAKVEHDIQIDGIDNLLIHTAVCCKPVPGDAVIGYITQRQGISIHRKDCLNLAHMYENQHHMERLIEVDWGTKTQQQYQVDLVVDAYDRPGLIRDVTQVLVSEHISILGLNCVTDKKQNKAHITLSIEIASLNPLSSILSRMNQLPNVMDARRI